MRSSIHPLVKKILLNLHFLCFVLITIKALLKIGIRGVTVSDVRGFGAQGGSTERHGGKFFENTRICFSDSSLFLAFLNTHLSNFQALSSLKTTLLRKLKWKSLLRKSKYVFDLGKTETF